jgi:hypothetical protein
MDGTGVYYNWNISICCEARPRVEGEGRRRDGRHGSMDGRTVLSYVAGKQEMLAPHHTIPHLSTIPPPHRGCVCTRRSSLLCSAFPPCMFGLVGQSICTLRPSVPSFTLLYGARGTDVDINTIYFYSHTHTIYIYIYIWSWNASHTRGEKRPVQVQILDTGGGCSM